ncbi:hypothetical protein M3Y99_00940000 [Aphelenchoides fujianensis]|nr:hypothetical protein M3Y99_00940000 [Aphelenchoides fujianensis]
MLPIPLFFFAVFALQTADFAPAPVTSAWKDEEPWVRTRAPSPLIDAKHDSFRAQCYQLGKIELADFLPFAYLNRAMRNPFATTAKMPTGARVKRWRTFDEAITAAPFRHPPLPPRPRYVCEENVQNYIKARCSPPAPRPMPTRLPNDTFVKDSAVLWVAHESEGRNAGRPLPRVWDVVQECCIDIARQCDCFFHFNERGTPTERVCDAVLTAAFYRPRSCAPETPPE